MADVADWLHVDVMDNHFVPNLTLGAPVVAALHKATTLPLDCHLMIDDPDRWAATYAEVGAGNVTFHAEAAADVVQTARSIRAAGARAGLAVKPGTDVESYLDVLGEFDMLLVMTVEPGFGGQEFLAAMMPKVRARPKVPARHRAAAVDSGRRRRHGRRPSRSARGQGADVFVAGSAVYGAHDPAAAVTALRHRASVLAAEAEASGR